MLCWTNRVKFTKSFFVDMNSESCCQKFLLAGIVVTTFEFFDIYGNIETLNYSKFYEISKVHQIHKLIIV